MPTPPEPDRYRPTLVVGGRAHADWLGYSIESDLMTPADAWQFRIGPSSAELPAAVVEGAPVQVQLVGQTILSGRIDCLTTEARRDGVDVTLHGRDGAAVLVDCSAPIFTARQIGLAEIAAAVARPLGVTRIRIDAATANARDKISVEPGDTAWDVIQHAAEANGLWPWFTPDGTLVIGRPTTPAAPVATLKLTRSGRDNNVVSLAETRDVSRRHSQVTVLGQTHGTGTQTGQHALSGAARDSGVAWYRPRIVVDHECDSTAIAQHRARKLLADSRLDGYTLTAELRGHLVDASARTPVPWAPGQRVHVVSEPHGLDEVMFVMARRFEGGRDRAPTTFLTLKQDGVWQLDAHPHQRQHRRGKNQTAGQIVDVSQP